MPIGGTTQVRDPDVHCKIKKASAPTWRGGLFDLPLRVTQIKLCGITG